MMAAATRFSVPDRSSERLIALCAMSVSDGPLRMAFFQCAFTTGLATGQKANLISCLRCPSQTGVSRSGWTLPAQPGSPSLDCVHGSESVVRLSLPALDIEIMLEHG